MLVETLVFFNFFKYFWENLHILVTLQNHKHCDFKKMIFTLQFYRVARAANNTWEHLGKLQCSFIVDKTGC